MKKNKAIFSLIIATMAILAVSFLWKKPGVLSLVLIALALFKAGLFPIKKELVWYIISGFLGSTTEIIAIYWGAWSYSSPYFLNIPFWLPLLWGLVGTVGISFYSALSE